MKAAIIQYDVTYIDSKSKEQFFFFRQGLFSLSLQRHFKIDCIQIVEPNLTYILLSNL